MQKDRKTKELKTGPSPDRYGLSPPRRTHCPAGRLLCHGAAAEDTVARQNTVKLKLTGQTVDLSFKLSRNHTPPPKTHVKTTLIVYFKEQVILFCCGHW